MRLGRRAFLSAFGAALAGATLDPERLLWVPGQRTIFVPPVGGWAGCAFVTPEWLTREALRILTENLMFSESIASYYDRGPAVGSQMVVRLPKCFESPTWGMES